jgi:hypothetical protein
MRLASRSLGDARYRGFLRPTSDLIHLQEEGKAQTVTRQLIEMVEIGVLAEGE